MKVILFDIDKTLIRGLRRKGDIWEDLFKEIYGRRGSLGEKVIVCHGMTMKQIVFEVLVSEGFSKEDVEMKWPSFRDALVKEYPHRLESVDVYDGVDEVLRDLQKRGFELGLITGNLEEIAMLKLKLAGLDHYFSFGGFGDNMNRDDAAKEAISGKEGDEIFTVGDAPLDISSGKKIGAKTVGVATGIYSVNDLKDAGADFVIDDIRKLREVFK